MHRKVEGLLENLQRLSRVLWTKAAYMLEHIAMHAKTRAMDLSQWFVITLKLV